MSQKALIDEKHYAYLIHLLESNKELCEIVRHSKIFVSLQNTSLFNVKPALDLLIDPEVFKKYFGAMAHVKKEIARIYGEITGIRIGLVKATPELSKFQILQNNIVPVFTPWQKINIEQNQLLEDLRVASTSADYQNIGNRSRIILQQLAEIVFDPHRHTAPPEVDLNKNMFKNRLHTYIKVELGDSQSDELRKFVLAVVDTAEKSIDLTNKVTHDLKANGFFGESCVISVVTTIDLIKRIHAKNDLT